jgi:hypothetical protein
VAQPRLRGVWAGREERQPYGRRGNGAVGVQNCLDHARVGLGEQRAGQDREAVPEGSRPDHVAVAPRVNQLHELRGGHVRRVNGGTTLSAATTSGRSRSASNACGVAAPTGSCAARCRQSRAARSTMARCSGPLSVAGSAVVPSATTPAAPASRIWWVRASSASRATAPAASNGGNQGHVQASERHGSSVYRPDRQGLVQLCAQTRKLS